MPKTADTIAIPLGRARTAAATATAGDRLPRRFQLLQLSGAVLFVGKWTGRTGKYAGLSGEFEITNSGNIAPDGLFQAAGKKTGSYRLGG